MTGPSSAPRGEHAGTRGAHWETQLVSGGEVVVDTDGGESPFGWSELDPPGPDMFQPLPPRPNRETRRAARRAARRTK